MLRGDSAKLTLDRALSTESLAPAPRNLWHTQVPTDVGLKQTGDW